MWGAYFGILDKFRIEAIYSNLYFSYIVIFFMMYLAAHRGRPAYFAAS